MKNSILSSKLKYLGLNLNKIPQFLLNEEETKIKTLDNLDQKNYKVYRYVKIKDIKFILTPTNRLTENSIKYSKGHPISYYFDNENQEGLEKFNEMLTETDINDIENLMEIQKNIAKQIPIKVKFNKDYLWQIYYEQSINQYFMLVPTEEREFSAFFYVLKKQLEKSEEEIFVPICNINYSKEYLQYKDINNLENYLHYFTKNWPMIYEVIDKKNNRTIEIIGKISIYANIKSDYKITLKSSEDALNFYKLIRALFILQTGLPYYFNFDMQINEEGQINFVYKDEIIDFKSLPKFVRTEYQEAKKKISEINDLKIELEEILFEMQQEEKKLYEDFLEKQKQISTFLECKKTFFGKVKYFFKYGKKNTKVAPRQEEKVIKKEKTKQEKETYDDTPNIDSLIDICNILISKTNEANFKKLDIEKMKTKIEILKKKIENAELYINEIDKHRKSIFDFWKFTNKDEANQLNEGIYQAIKNKKIKKSFDFEQDFEETAQLIDTKQRNTLTKDEINSIFVATTEVLNDIKLLQNNKKIPEKHLDNLKKELSKNGLDVLGSEEEFFDNTHRETKKNLFSILGLTEETRLEEYTESIQKILNNINKAFSKLDLEMDMPLYMVDKKKIDTDLEVFYIDPTEILESNKKEINLHRITINNKVSAIGFSNIIFYNNTNKTLPVGMDYSTGILLNLKGASIELKKTKTNNIIIFENNKIKATKLNIFEYDI